MVTDMQTNLSRLEEIWTWLDSVRDPEIPVLSVIDLGIVREVKWSGDTDFTTKTQRTQRSELTLVVTITPTYSGCPAMNAIKADILRGLQQQGINQVRLETQLSPAWTTDWMTERGRKRLLEYGIAPPGMCGRLAPGGRRVRSGERATLQHSTTPAHNASRSDAGGPSLRPPGFEHEHEAPGGQDDPVPCPRCGSADTRLVSRFGSTPCKAFYICKSCLEPFDYFKCH
jgi:ring-1,2-phenylacetyl-CoA epoxidase subunit PaaD